MNEPKSFIQGESLKWTRCFGTPNALEGSTITYYFRGPGKGFDVVGSTDNFEDFTFVVPGTVTAQMQPGVYNWQAISDNGDERILSGCGTVEVKAGLAAMPADQIFDGRSENKKTLDAIRAMIAGRATLDQQEYAIGNRSLKRIPIPDLIALESHYAQKVRRENEAARLQKGGKFFKQIQIRMKG